MSLLARIIASNTLCLLIVIAFTASAGFYLLESQRKTFSERQRVALAALWNQALTIQKEKLGDSGKSIARDREFKSALGDQDKAKLQEGIGTSFNLLASLNLVDEIIVINNEKTHLASLPKETTTLDIKNPLVLEAFEKKKTSFGVIASSDKQLSLQYTLPITKRGKVLGAVIYLQHIDKVLKQVSENSSAHGLVTKADGTVIADYVLPPPPPVAEENAAAGDSEAHAPEEAKELPSKVSEMQGFDPLWASGMQTIMPEHVELEGDMYRITSKAITGQDEAQLATIMILQNDNESFEQTQSTMKGAIVIVIGLLVVILLINLTMTRKWFAPLRSAIVTTRQIAEGDLTIQVKAQRNDEIGQMLTSIANMTSGLHGIVSSIVEQANQLEHVSHELGDTSQGIRSETQGVSARGDAVNAKAQELRKKMDDTLNAVKQSVERFSVISQSATELSQTVAEISDNAQNASAMSSQANSTVKGISEKLEELETATHDINNIVQLIVEISDQTKLLALNATIEAARAGEQGKGFAVVANEVKDLATRTNDAIVEINSKVTNMNEVSVSTAAGIKEVGTIMDQMNSTVSGISEAITRHNATTQEMAETITKTSDSTQQMYEDIEQATQHTQDVSQEMQAVKSSCGVMQEGAQTLTKHTQNMAQASDTLKEKVGKFKV